MPKVRFEAPAEDARWETLEENEADAARWPPVHAPADLAASPDPAESPQPLDSPERRGAPGHYTHTAHRRHRESTVDRHHESTLPSLSPSGTLRSPGGRELARDNNGALSSPGGTVRPGVVASPGGTVRLGVLKDNYVDGGWAPLTREQLRKARLAPGKERAARFADDFVADSASSTGSSEKKRRHHLFVLGRRLDHHRLSTSHQQLLEVGHTGTLELDADWGGLVGGLVTRQSVLRFLSCVVTLVDCVVLANREASRNPYHPTAFNPRVVSPASPEGAKGYGWGGAGTAHAYFETSMLAFLVWDVLVSAFITAEVWGRLWQDVIAGFLQRRRQRLAEAREARLAAQAAEEEASRAAQDPRSADELASVIEQVEAELKATRVEQDVKLLATKPTDLEQWIMGRSAEDKEALAEIQGRIDSHVAVLTDAQRALETLRRAESDRTREAYVMTLSTHELQATIRDKTKHLKSVRREPGASVYFFVLRWKSKEQKLAITKLEAEISELTLNLQLLQSLRPDTANSSQAGSSLSDSSKVSFSESDNHIAGENARNEFVSHKRAVEHRTFYRYLALLDVVIVVSSWLHIILAPLGVPFTLRPLRLFRALYWLSVDFCIHALRGIFYALSVARGYVQAGLVLLLIFFVTTSTFLFSLYTTEGAHFRCILCPGVAAHSAGSDNTGGGLPGGAGSAQPSATNPDGLCFDNRLRFNSGRSPFPEFMVPEQWCHRLVSGGSTCPSPFECVDVREFVEFTPFHLDNYLGVMSVLYSIFSQDGNVAHMVIQVSKTVVSLQWLYGMLVVGFILLAAVLGLAVLRATVMCSLMQVWRRVPLVDMDSDWFKIEGWTPWDPNRQRPKYLPPPVDFGPGLAAGNMSPLSQRSSPVRRGSRKEFRNTDTVVVDPFSKVQPRLNLRAACVGFGESRWCEALSCLLIVVHYIMQVSWHAGMSPGYSRLLVTSEAVILSVFLLEMCIKVYAAGGISNFASSLWRAAELAVVSMSFAAFAADICQCPGPTNLFVVAIKSLVHLRLLRILAMETGMHFICCRFVKGGSAALSILIFTATALGAMTIIAKVAVGYRVQTWATHDCHSTGGQPPCVLPFDYKGIKFTSCTSFENDGRLWCATTENFERDGLWAECSCDIPRHSIGSLYIEEGARASFKTMAWGLLTNFRVLTGDDFSSIYSDSLATSDNTGAEAYTFLLGLGLVMWHLFAYAVLQAGLLAYTLEYFSFSSWQHHWHHRPFLAGLDILVFDTVFGEEGRIQKFADALVEKASDLYFEVSLFFARHRIQPIQEHEVEQLPSILSYGGEETPAIQSWWKNTPVVSNSPVAQSGDSTFKRVEPAAGNTFLRHADHFLKPDENTESMGTSQGVGLAPPKATLRKSFAMSKKTAAEITMALQTVDETGGLEPGEGAGAQNDLTEPGESQNALAGGHTSKGKKSWKTLKLAVALANQKQEKMGSDDRVEAGSDGVIQGGKDGTAGADGGGLEGNEMSEGMVMGGSHVDGKVRGETAKSKRKKPWMNLKIAVSLGMNFMGKKTAEEGDATDAQKPDANDGKSSDSSTAGEERDQVGELETRVLESRGSKRPGTRGSEIGSVKSSDSKFSQSVHFSVYDDQSSGARSNQSRASHVDNYESEVDSESETSPKSVPSPPRKTVETVYIDDIFGGANIDDARPITSQSKRDEEERRENLPRRVLFCLTNENRLRKFLISVDHNRNFKLFIHLLVAINFIVVASAPMGWGKLDGSLRAKRGFFDFVTGMLALEFWLKIVTFGLLMTPEAVLRSPVRLAELLIIVLALSDGGYSGRHVLGCSAKCCRLLWILSSVAASSKEHGKCLRCLLQGIFSAGHPLSWCLVLLFLITSLFSIVGMRLAGGKMASCSDTVTLLYPEGRIECVSTHITGSGVMLPRVWSDAALTFNNLPQSLLTLIVVSTMRWSRVNDDLMDASSQGLQSLRLNLPEISLFLACFITIVSFMLGNLMIAYVVNAIRDSESLHDKRTRRYILFKNRVIHWTPKETPKISVWKGAELAESMLKMKGFQLFFETANVMAIGFMLIEHTDAPPQLVMMLEIQRFVFGCLLFAELFFNFQTFGIIWVLQQPRHLANILPIAGLIVFFSGKAIRGKVYPGERWIQSPLFRLVVLLCEKGRIIRLILKIHEYSTVSHWVPMRVIFTTIRFCAWRLANVLILAVVLLMILAAVGMQLFSHTRDGEKLGQITSVSNFNDAWSTLFYVFAGDQWQLLLFDCSVTSPDCTAVHLANQASDSDMGVGDCGSPILAILYFVGVKFTLNSVLFGAMMWALVESFHEATDVEEGRIQNLDLAMLGNAWKQDQTIVGDMILLSHVDRLLQQLPIPLRLVTDEQVHKTGEKFKHIFGGAERPYMQHPVVLRFMIELSILAWCRKQQRQKNPMVPHCPVTAYPDIRGINTTNIHSHKKVSYFDLTMTLMHTVTPEVQSEHILELRRPMLLVVEKVMAALRISAWLKRTINMRIRWATLLDRVHQAVIHLREQEALEKERLQREQEEAEAAEALRLKRLRDEIYNLETWVVKICPQWEQDELERQRREELEEERLERLQYYIPEQDDTALSAPQSEGTARTVSDGASENIERVESGARSGKELFKLLQKSAKSVQAITRLHRGDTRTDSYFARCVYYKICIPYGTQSGSPLAPSTTEHIEGHPFWRTSASSFRTVAVPMAPHSHPAAKRAEERDEGQKGKKKKSKAKGRSRFGYGAYSAEELCAVVNALIYEDLQYYIKANQSVHYTHGLTEEVWDTVCASLIQFLPPPPDHSFPGDSPTSPGAIKGQISLKIEWPGHIIGREGLVGWGVKEEEAKNASVSVLCGEHSFYAMARHAKDGLFDPQPNLMSFLGICKGNKPYFCPIFGNQNAVTLGGTNKLVDHPVAYKDLESLVIMKHTEVMDDDDTFERGLAVHAQYEEAKRAAGEYLLSFMGFVSRKTRPEVLALLVLQAMMKRRLLRFKWTGMALMKSKLGDESLAKLNILQFMSRPERRMNSMTFLQTGTKTIASPLPDARMRDFSPLPSHSPGSPVAAERGRQEQERLEREKERTGRFRRRDGTTATAAAEEVLGGTFKRGATRRSSDADLELSRMLDRVSE